MDNKLSLIIGERINQLLSAHGVKQKELAEYLGILDNTISYFCSGRRMPNTAQIKAIAEYFGVSTDYLLGVSNAATSDKDIQFIGDYLNLSEGAIRNLHSVWFNDTRLLNFMLENAYPFSDICAGMAAYDLANRELNAFMDKVINSGDDSVEADGEYDRLTDKADLARYKIQQAFNTLVDFYSPNPRNQKSNAPFWEIYSRSVDGSKEGDPDGQDQETE